MRAALAHNRPACGDKRHAHLPVLLWHRPDGRQSYGRPAWSPTRVGGFCFEPAPTRSGSPGKTPSSANTDHGRDIYRQRRETVEPVFGHTKHNRGFTRFHRRGRLAARTEWRLMMSTHNLTKLYRHQLAAG